jgi:hypothetical protein
LPGQRRHHMDVIRRMPDRHPTHPEFVIPRREPSPVHDVRRELSPLPIRQQPVPRRRPNGAMPHRLLVASPVHGRNRLSQQPTQPTQIVRAIDPVLRLQLGRIAKPSNQVRIRVLIRPARSVQ